MPDDHEPGCRCRRCRQRADAELVAWVLSDRDDAAVAWDELQERLTVYAYPVLVKWGRTGRLHEQARRAGVLGSGRVPVALKLTQDDARQLAIEIIEMALHHFPTNALPKWNAERGRNVKTYFVNWCLMKLPAAYERWYRREVAPLIGHASLDVIAEAVDVRLGPEELAEIRQGIRELARGDRLAQRIVLMRLEGYTYAEISSALHDEWPHMSERKVRAKLKDLARRARDLRSRRNDQ